MTNRMIMEKQKPDSSREKILQAVRNAQQRTAAVSSLYDVEAVYVHPDNLLDVFVKEVEAVAGECLVFSSREAMLDHLAELAGRRGWDYLYTCDTELAGQATIRGIAAGNDPGRFENMQAAVTSCEALVARTGSVVMSSVPAAGRQVYAYTPVHIVIAREDQLVAYPEDALRLLQARYGNRLPSAMGFVTGPSRTADIEKTLVLGAHGPKELIIFVLKN